MVEPKRERAGFVSRAAEGGGGGAFVAGITSWATAQPWGDDGLGLAIGALVGTVWALGASYLRDRRAER